MGHVAHDNNARADILHGIKTNAAIGVLALVLFFVRGGEFKGLGQLLVLVICFMIAQIAMDVSYLVRDTSAPADWKFRYLPIAVITVALFALVTLVAG